MPNELMCIDTQRFRQFPTLLTHQDPKHVAQLFALKIGTPKVICYETQLKHSDAFDVLFGFKTSDNNINALIHYLSAQQCNERTSCFISLLEKLKTGDIYWPVKLYWLSFDWADNLYPVLPSFCLSTQHPAFNDEKLLKQVIQDVYRSVGEQYQYIVPRIFAAGELNNLKHLGVTFARSQLRFKFTYKLTQAALFDLLDSLEWPGDIQQLTAFYHRFLQWLDEVQVSVSFQADLTSRIEIEFPWLSEQNHDLTDLFTEQLAQFFDISPECLRKVSAWYKNKRLDEAALYFKATLEYGQQPLLKVYYYHQVMPIHFFKL
ncbi:hypothetical protein PULV_a1068 [Pseudoalteromonas ulvae UL12]|uniref:hypothetical protein n=1 Tax=Pseudoalteromonas ulvae TaxID=107327 RepID=UPI00186B8C62|nr:hypothetical protein [Pseudoalteromonas ulvae]MBE0363601.1 hypothetical protein [Pseudoalteromonas ulvae UL12]